eukprot:8668505-Alexandrium_andersonii.AAC.1
MQNAPFVSMTAPYPTTPPHPQLFASVHHKRAESAPNYAPAARCADCHSRRPYSHTHLTNCEPQPVCDSNDSVWQ